MALKALQQVQELLTVQQPLLGQSFDAVMDAQCTNMAVLLQNNPITMDDSTELNATIAAGPWTQQQKEKLATLLASQLVNTMKETSTGKAKRKQNQELRNFYGYLTAEDKAILSAQGSLHSRLSHAAHVCGKLQLLWPSEQTVGHVLNTVAHFNNTELQTAADYLHAVQTIKKLIKAHEKASTRGFFLQTYPDDPHDLPAEVKDGFSQAERGSLTLQAVQSTGPLRASHNTVRGMVGPSKLKGVQGMPAAMHSTMLQMLSMCSPQLQHMIPQLDPDLPPGFRLLGPAASTHPPVAHQAFPAILAHPAASSAQQALPALMAPPSPAPTTPAPTTAPTTPLPAPMQVTTLEEPSPAKQQSPVSPAQQAEAMLAAWTCNKEKDNRNEEDQDEIKDAGMGRGGRGRGRGGPGRGRGRRGAGGGRRGGTGRGRGDPMKKPCAVIAPKVLKRPAAAIPQNRREAAAITKHDRMVFRPKGCYKCRWSPGCTPSCYD